MVGPSTNAKPRPVRILRPSQIKLQLRPRGRLQVNRFRAHTFPRNCHSQYAPNIERYPTVLHRGGARHVLRLGHRRCRLAHLTSLGPWFKISRKACGGDDERTRAASGFHVVLERLGHEVAKPGRPIGRRRLRSSRMDVRECSRYSIRFWETQRPE